MCIQNQCCITVRPDISIPDGHIDRVQNTTGRHGLLLLPPKGFLLVLDFPKLLLMQRCGQLLVTGILMLLVYCLESWAPVSLLRKYLPLYIRQTTVHLHLFEDAA